MAPDSINTAGGNITVNGRRYALPKRPTVVVCIDGSDPGYIEGAVAAGRAPWFARVLKSGTNLIADCVVPSFTNPNNLSIVTGRPPAVHGICGNYFLDPDTGKEVMMNDPKFLRVETLFPPFQRAGCRIAVVTARTSCAGCWQGPDLGRARPAPSSRSPTRPPWPRTARDGMNLSACRYRRLQRRPVGVRLRRRREADGARPAGDHVSLDHRLHPAQHAPARRSPTTLRDDGRLHGKLEALVARSS